MSAEETTEESYIDPKQLIAETSIEEFNHHSDNYYKNLVLPEFQMGKPFATPMETSRHLLSLGMVLEELRLGPGTRVLDFGAGTCWIAKALWQMGCDVTAIDVSETALELGRRLFEDYPVPMRKNGDWKLLPFDGIHLPLEDESVERIICYDTFHHVPNQDAVISEFYRVLTQGGIIALNEPVGEHSKTEASQREMRDYKVLENDLEIEDLKNRFETVGFSSPRFRVLPTQDLSLDYENWSALRRGEPCEKASGSLKQFANDSAIFSFQKGSTQLDSRTAEGLSHTLKADATQLEMQTGVPFWINLQISNTGDAIWLHGEGTETGIVNVGTQKIDPATGAQIGEHARFHLPRDIAPGESIEIKIHIILREPGHFQLRLDLVSELVCWFHQRGSEPVLLDCFVD